MLCRPLPLCPCRLSVNRSLSHWQDEEAELHGTALRRVSYEEILEAEKVELDNTREGDPESVVQRARWVIPETDA
jgi:hypothetical protein